MNIAKLVDFVKSGEIIDKIKGEYKQIVSDFNFGNIDKTDGFVKIDKFGDLDKIDKTKTTLFILDKLLPEHISKYFDMNYLTILDLNFGISGYGNNLGISKLDLGSLIDKDFSIYEPINLVSLLENMGISGKKYIRINNYDLPEDFLGGDLEDIIFIPNKSSSKGMFTIITTGSMLSELVRISNILDEHKLSTNIFVLNKLNFDLDDKYYKLMTNNKNIVFILDSINSSSYEEWIKTKFKNLNIKFFYPEYKNLTTVLDDYKNEETLFDSKSLVDRILNHKNISK